MITGLLTAERNLRRITQRLYRYHAEAVALFKDDPTIDIVEYRNELLLLLGCVTRTVGDLKDLDDDIVKTLVSIGDLLDRG